MKEIIEGIDCSWYKDCIYYKQCELLKQENEELKARVKILNRMTGIFSARLAEKYRQALEEIREIVSGNYEILDPQAKKEIQTKINEVLNTED